jgi:hypothetical protein
MATIDVAAICISCSRERGHGLMNNFNEVALPRLGVGWLWHCLGIDARFDRLSLAGFDASMDHRQRFLNIARSRGTIDRRAGEQAAKWRF